MANTSQRPLFFIEELKDKVINVSPQRDAGFVRISFLGAEQWVGVWVKMPSVALARNFLRKFFDQSFRIRAHESGGEVELELPSKPDWLDAVYYNTAESKLQFWVKDKYRMKRDREHIVQEHGSLQVFIDDIPWLATTRDEKIELMRERGRQITEGVVSHMQANSHIYSFALDNEGKVMVVEKTWDGESKRYPLIEEAERSAEQALSNTLPLFVFDDSVHAFWDGFREGMKETVARVQEILSDFKRYEAIMKEAERAGEDRSAELKATVEDNMLPVGFAWIVFEQGHPFTEAFVKSKELKVDPKTASIWQRAMPVTPPFQSLILKEDVAEAMVRVFQKYGIPCRVHAQWD